ncbi:magnesium transporter [Planctomycetota bacterium]|nr:magnesium transporter [Planctomycetota bacterium]
MTTARLLNPEITDLLNQGDFSALRDLSKELHAADMAEIVEQVKDEHILLAFLSMARESQPEIFGYLEPSRQELLLAQFKPTTLTHVLAGISADDRTELLHEIPGALTRRVLEALEPDERKVALSLLGYPEASVGRLMTPDFLHISAESTASDALAKVRRLAAEVETVYVLYVVDADGTLIGTASLRDVVVAKSFELVKDFMTEKMVVCKSTDDRESALTKLREYDLLALPVVDSQKRLVGIVTFDDLVDVSEDEATEDILKMHGVATDLDDYFDDTIWKKYRSRVVWLVPLAFVGAGSVLVQQAYNPIIAQLSLLAAYITLLTATGGNVGTQSAGIMIRAISTDDVDKDKLKRIFRHELLIGVALGLTLAIVGTCLVLIRGADPNVLGGHEIWEVAMIVGSSMFLAVVTTNALGAFMPLFSKLLRIDPAVTAGPFITTAADIVIVLVYFNIATAVILGS